MSLHLTRSRRRGTALLELAWATPWLALGFALLVSIVDAGEVAGWSSMRARRIALGGAVATGRTLRAVVTRYDIAEHASVEGWAQNLPVHDPAAAAVAVWSMAEGLAWTEAELRVNGEGVRSHGWIRAAPGPALGARRRDGGDHRGHAAFTEHWGARLPVYRSSSPAWRLGYEPVRDSHPYEGKFVPRAAWEEER